MNQPTGGGPAYTPLGQRQRDQYLAYGYLPELPEGDPLALLGSWSRAPRRDVRSVSESALVTEGVRALKAAFEACAAQSAPSPHHEQVVFLSGGLDSRTILGGLLDAYQPQEVLTATFGLPGEKDFDFAAQVAAVAGVRHEVLESFSVDWTTQGLVDSVLAREIPLPHPFGQRYLSYHLHRRIGAEHSFWDGWCGDVVGGAHLARAGDRRTWERWTWEEAVAHFVQSQLVPGFEDYTSPGFRPESVMPVAPFCSGEELVYPDQLNLGVRQTRYIATRRMRGYTIRTPFLSEPWVDFMLSVPIDYRMKQRLYQAIQQQAYPRLFSLPTTRPSSSGVRASRLANRARAARRHLRRAGERVGLRSARDGQRGSGANDAIRRSHLERADVRGLIVDNLEDLAGRGVVPGLQPGAVAAAVAEGGISDTRISVLLGLEINLKAVDQLSGTGVDSSGRRGLAAG